MNLITQKGFGPYFLIVKDIVLQTKSTIGRGSAAASVVSYCLFITQVDPIKYNLSFDRFIHPERMSMPDIDIDFPWDERDDIINYVFRKYGDKRTAMVANQVFLKPRSAIREVGKVHGLPNEQINSITKRIRFFNFNKKLKTQIRNDSVLNNIDLDEKLKEVLRHSKKILGVFRYSSVHPGGVVIVPDKLSKYVPILNAPKGVQIVEWEKDQVEDSGLLKIDILGNRSLAVVRDTIKQINLTSSSNDRQYINYHKIQPIEDEKTREIMRAGKTIGVFYIESPSIRQLMAKAGIVNFEHIIIFSSIIRPAANRFTSLMLDRIHGAPWNLIHKDLSFLSETYGIIVYEEQVSMVLMVMTGVGFEEAKTIRKIISRDIDKNKIDNCKNLFLKKSMKRGYEIDVINQVWGMISSFKGFSFCKPHSASYAMLAFTCAYLKTHFTAEFLASVISNQGGYYSSYAYMSEESLNDFLFRVKIDLSDAMVLTNAQCFKRLCNEKNHREIAYIVAEFYLNNDNNEPLSNGPIKEELTKSEICQLEYQTFGYPVSTHPLDLYRSFISKNISFACDIPKRVGKSIYLLGVYITSKDTITGKNEQMKFLTLEDETEIYECVLFPKVFLELGDVIQWETLFVLRGEVKKTFGVHTVIVDRIGSLTDWMRKIKVTGST